MREVDLDQPSKFGDREVALLNRFRNVQDVDLAKSAITDQGLDALDLPKVRYLSLDQTNVSPAAVARLRRFQDLEILHVGPSTRDDGELFAAAMGLTGLQTFGGNKLHLDDDGVRLVPGYPGLRRLGLLDSRVSESGIVEILGRCRELESLTFGPKPVSDRTLEAIAAHPAAWKRLWVHGGGVTDAGLRALGRQRGFERLALIGCSRITDQGVLDLFDQLPNLESVELPYSSITDGLLRGLAGRRALKLQDIDLRGPT